MAINFLPFLISGAMGALGGAIGAAREAAILNEQRNNSGLQRQRLDAVIANLRGADYSALVDGASRNLTRGLQASRANAYQGGLANSGIQRSQENILSAEIAAALASQMMSDRLQRESAIANIYQNSAYADVPSKRNVGLEGLLGFLTGGAAAVGSTLNSTIGMGLLDGGGGDMGQGNAKALSGYNFGVKTQGTSPFSFGGNSALYGLTPEFLNYLGNTNLAYPGFGNTGGIQ